MKISGLFFLIFGWGVVIYLVFYCMKEILKKKKELD